MAQIEKLAHFILKWEGGFVDHRNDRGGATNKGVTLATWQHYCKSKGKVGDVASLKRMTNEEWIDILREYAWDVWKADEIESQRVANICVDWVWGSGPKVIKKVQKMLGLTADGIVGPKTLASINGHSADSLFGKVKEARNKFYHGIVKNDPTQAVFLRGWLNRLEEIARL